MAITREELEEYQILQAERKALDRKSKTIEAREKSILEKVHAEVMASGKHQIIRFGFGLVLEPGRASVPWKEAFIKACGTTAATQLQEQAAKEAEETENRKAKIIPPISP